MVRRKSTKGKECLTRVETFESIPRCYFNVERVMFPKALNEQTNNPEGKTCLMGELLEKFGFNNRKLANDLTKSTIESEEKINSVVREKENAINEFKKTESFKKDLKTRLDALL
ncbi:hypothetical protein A0H76_1917 [Hepatospora eriocheir]|uniref:Uncharacterized protein n=1 Tax=Hepatospora eriocheir TaxID=1081669 RepID=A0A1X0QG86_9MICR|nr:hypothetical protein A0H76_1917 [Hepatospora eriocheir]